MLDDLPPFLTVIQAGEVLQLGRSTCYELTVQWDCTGGAAGLPFVWFGRQKRIPRDALVRYVESQLTRSVA
jgi:hypothetical protein